MMFTEPQPNIQTLQQILRSNPKDLNAYQTLCFIYCQNQQFKDALKISLQALQCYPHMPSLHNNISNIYKKLGHAEKAIMHIKQAIQINPNYAEAYNNLGSIYYLQNQFQPAIKCFKKALRIHPFYFEAHFNLGNSLIQTNQLFSSITHYQAALKEKPYHHDTLLNLGLAYIQTQQYQAAIPYLEKIIHENPNALLMASLGDAYFHQGQLDKAMAMLKAAVSLEPKRSELHHNLAILYLKQQQPENAKRHFKQALVLNKNNMTAQHMVNALDPKKHSASAPLQYIQDLFDQYAPYYNDHMTKTLQYQVPQTIRQAIQPFVKAHTSAKKILELGCGTGLCSPYFRDIANFLVGVDISLSMLLQAKIQGGYDALCQCDIQTHFPGFSQAYFDIIVAADVLVYLGDLKLLFQSVAQALTPSGIFVFTIERNFNDHTFTLMPTGRYAHHLDYVTQLAYQHQFNLYSTSELVLRTHLGQPVQGMVVVLIKND